MSGFTFHERLSGIWRSGGDERAFAFTASARVSSLQGFVKDFRAVIEGFVDANGLAHHAPLQGTMVLNPLLGRVIGYDFTFMGDSGATYRFAGQKDIDLADPVRTFTTLPGLLTDADGNEVGSVVVHFDLRDLPRFLASFRALT